jgi:hypothetical protein
VAAVLLLSVSAYAVTPAQKCQEQKLKAQGKLQLCLKKNSAKVLAGNPDASAACQTKFSAALTKAGTACRYLDNGDGTVSDLNTGLVWEKKDNLDGAVNASDPHDADNTYTWCSGSITPCTNSADPPDGTAFTTFLYGLNGGTSPDGVAISGCFTGRCDWRLPTIAELSGILDLSAAGCGSGSPLGRPCIDPTFGPTQDFGYWSATTVAGNPFHAWLIDLIGGTVRNTIEKPNNTIYVRAVRGGL